MELRDCVFFYPCRYSDLIPLFGHPVPELCMISNEVADFIYERHGEKITRWNHQLLNPHQLQLYANAYTKGQHWTITMALLMAR